FQYRYGKAFDILEELKQQGFLTRPLTASLETHWDRRSDYYEIPWRGTWKHELGGAVLSHAIHAHDLLSQAFGPVAQVSAFTTTRANPIETEDCASIAFRMQNGSTATSSITLGASGNSSRFRFVFDDITIESDSDEEFAYTPGEGNWTFKARVAEKQNEIDEIVATSKPQPEGFEGFCTAIADAFDGTSDSEVKLSDGVTAIELATAIYHSDRTGSQVSLPLDRSLPICNGLAL
ncbi:MAG: Gfo/Idh/MocA family oxidoreductase, partial [Pseudomonadota bacterium]